MVSFTHPATIVADVIEARREQLLELVRRRSRAALDAEDVLHAAIVRALERSSQLRDPARAEAWVGRVVQNALRDALRQRRESEMLGDELAAPAPDEDAERCGCVLEQVKQMRPAQAEILQRVIVDDVPVTRLAAELGITANTAMVRLHRTSVLACSDCGC